MIFFFQRDSLVENYSLFTVDYSLRFFHLKQALKVFFLEHYAHTNNPPTIFAIF